MRVKTPIAGLLLATTLMAVVGCSLGLPPTAAPTVTLIPSPLPTQTAAPTATPAHTPTTPPSPTATPVPTPTETPMPTPPPSPTPTSTPVPTATPPPTSTPVPTLSPEEVAATEALVPGWLDAEYKLVEFLLELKLNHAEASALFESMGWVQDRIGNSDYELLQAEVRTASKLRDIWQVGPSGQELFLALLCKPWMQDGLSTNESDLIGDLTHVLEGDPDGALSLVQMPFLDTTEEAVESRIVNLVSNLPYYSIELREILSRPEFADGITDDHVTTLQLMYYETQEPEAVAAIEALPWVQD